MVSIISPIFSSYFNRYLRVYISDIGVSHDAQQDLKNVLLYMMATMNARTREILLEHGERMESVIISAYQLCFRLDISPEILILKAPQLEQNSLEKLFDDVCKDIAEPYKSSFIIGFSCCLNFGIDLSEKLLRSLLKAHVEHELLHQLTGSPFNAYGEIYTVLISDKLDLVHNSEEYKFYCEIIIKSKYIQMDWKRKQQLYYDDILRNKKDLLIGRLYSLAGDILAGKTIRQENLALPDLLVYPETQPITFGSNI